jgi:hypothetical protein
LLLRDELMLENLLLPFEFTLVVLFQLVYEKLMLIDILMLASCYIHDVVIEQTVIINDDEPCVIMIFTLYLLRLIE